MVLLLLLLLLWLKYELGLRVLVFVGDKRKRHETVDLGAQLHHIGKVVRIEEEFALQLGKQSCFLEILFY